MNVYGWTKNEVDIRNIYLKKHGMFPPQWVALKFLMFMELMNFIKKIQYLLFKNILTN